MAHGYLTPTDLRSDRNYLGAIAGAIGSRIGKASNMAARERAYASKKAKSQGTTLKDEGMGEKGYFFKRALGSSFGGDRIARTRGRFETDPGPGRDPSGTQSSRFRGGFNYDFSKPTGGALANIVSPGGGGGGSGFPGGGAGPAINPDVLGGALVTSQFRQTKQNTNVAVDTTATEVKDLAGILNQIGQIIVSSSNSTIQAVDSVQQVNVQVVQGIKSLGQLQAQIAQRQEMLQLQAAQEQQQMMSRMLAASEKSQFTEDDFSGNLTPDKDYGKGGKGGGFIGGLVSRLSDFFGMRMGGPGIGGGGGFGGAAGGVGKALGTNKGSMVNRMGGNFLARNATRMFGRGGLMPFLRPIFKRIPIFGGLIDFAVSLALGEPVGRAAAKAVGATLGAGLGSLIPVPGVGTIAGGILGDFAGGAIYDAIAGGSGGENKETVPQLAGGARITGSKDGVLVRVGEGGRGKDELVKPLNKKIFEQEEQARLDVLYRNRKRYGILQAEGLKHYYEKEDGWTKGWKKLTDWIKKLGGQLSRWLFGNGNNDENPLGRSPNEGFLNRRSRGLSGSAFTGTAASVNPLLEKFLPTPAGGRPATLTAGNSGTTTNFAEQRRGYKHEGVDIGTDVGADVMAIEDGKVIDAYNNGYGEHGGAVIVEHADKTRYVYGHVTPTVKTGDTVKAGEHIADVVYYPYTDSSGITHDYTHLHLERINTNNKKVDAISHLAAQENLEGPNERAAETPSGITPEQVIPLPSGLSLEPPSSGRPSGMVAEGILRDRSALLKTMAKFRDQSQNAAAFIKRDGKSKGEKLSIPGVGSIVKDRPLFGDWFNKYFNASGQLIDAEQFGELIIKQREKNKDRLNKFNEGLGLDPNDTRSDPWASANADTGNGVLQASATTDAADRAAKTQLAFLNVPTQQPQSSGGDSSAAILAAMGQASSSPRGWTPSGIYNSILEA